MTYKVDLSKQRAVVIAPTNLEEEVSQNIWTILSTPLGSAPLAATVGIAMDDLDEPINIVKAKLSARILTAIATLEPRATITNINFKETDHATGRLVPVVKFTLKEGVT
ncbi:GPW/gp25 family protein [Paenibacillus larvae]|uniref:Baseplate wedge protein n=2 Tax=root TaxID=1 RepID=A0A0C5ABJ8_9CAUD|nr:GPW/gp25 family protein [Paenibacillus larvae]YP_009202228.1 GPW/gp25 family protein [Bacteriophage Lily]AJK27746.1 baseplate wedge protein [Bacteriophage Lily]MCY9564621.1 GPW/gp25 family protein [Paenibacillus larvae]MCY9568351.1 GPW/gp25 family protein [Paenibacillus larvae]MCY9571691.1 GPW/gp25 family protein [Paenibacillus larvae]MCY9690624.1 GPW/gp25 family protein [Paenibacillus larvae]